MAGGPAPFISGLLVLWMGGKPWGVALYSADASAAGR
jgi:hypothetical protein